MGPEKIQATVKYHQKKFLSRPRVQATYRAAIPYQRSVIDRFATVAAACRMAIKARLLPWDIEDTDSGIESCIARWAQYDNRLEPVIVAIIEFMDGRQSWEGTAQQLSARTEWREEESEIFRALAAEIRERAAAQGGGF